MHAYGGSADDHTDRQDHPGANRRKEHQGRCLTRTLVLGFREEVAGANGKEDPGEAAKQQAERRWSYGDERAGKDSERGREPSEHRRKEGRNAARRIAIKPPLDSAL